MKRGIVRDAIIKGRKYDLEREKAIPSKMSELHDENETIIRYLSIAKFLHLIQSKTLFFSPISKMKDLNEALVHDGSSFQEALMKITGSSETLIQQLRDKKETDQIEIDGLKAYYNLSCWTQDIDENYALWKIYVDSGEGVAIVSSKGALRDNIDNNISMQLIQGNVRYIEPLNKVSDQVFFRKAPPYYYENEYRVGLDITRFNDRKRRDDLLLENSSKGGVEIKIDLKFIERIIVSPFSGTWLTKVVENICSQEKIEVPISQSVIKERYF